jgi:two-component system copper resistance phosphate regulon response regulator CusR
MKILIIEDEPKTSAYLAKGLEEQGYTVHCAGNGEDGFHMARVGEYDLLILDVMLPGKDGWSILSDLRRS